MLIEYALLFGLGFLSACLFGMLIAPFVHRRIVKYTENRLKATTPLNAAEVRAQKDMVRAVMAAEQARTLHDLGRQREKTSELMVENERANHAWKEASDENEAFRSQVGEMTAEAADLRANLRDADMRIEALRQDLNEAVAALVAETNTTANLNRRNEHLSLDISGFKIDLAARETEIENLKMRLHQMREERQNLRIDLKAATDRSRDFELRLAREENKVLRLEERLEREAAAQADKDTTIDRRQAELNELKDKLKQTSAEAREAAKALKAAGLAKPVIPAAKTPRAGSSVKLVSSQPEAAMAAAAAPTAVSEAAPSAQPLLARAAQKAKSIDTRRMADDVRSRGAALIERLQQASDPANDISLREELADIAASMIVMTVAREGHASPINKILVGKSGHSSVGRLSLAERSAAALEDSLGKPGV